jgi:putative copper export protein
LHEKFCKLFEDKVTAVLTGTGHSGKECRHATEHICFNILHLLSVSTWNLSS